MKNNPIFFSVIIPTRNRPGTFNKALNSVLAQNYSNFEVIVVNDGSSPEHIHEYQIIKQSCDKRVRFIELIERSRGHGHCFARNQGVEAAQGNFICFLDDDDWWLDRCFLERAAEMLVKYNADFYFANQTAVTHDGKVIENIWVADLANALAKNDPRHGEAVFPVTVDEALLASGFPHMNCWALSKTLYERIGGMDENLRYEPDRDIYIRVLDNASCMLYDKTVISLHNVPDQSQTNNASTLTNKLEKLLFQQRTAEKGIIFSKNKVLRQFCKKLKGYILKKIAFELYQQKQYRQSLHYSLQGLITSPTLKWFLQTLLTAANLLYSNISQNNDTKTS